MFDPPFWLGPGWAGWCSFYNTSRDHDGCLLFYQIPFVQATNTKSLSIHVNRHEDELPGEVC